MSLPDVVAQTPLLPPPAGKEGSREPRSSCGSGRGGLRAASGTQSQREREAGISSRGLGLLAHSCEGTVGIHSPPRSTVRGGSAPVNPFTHRSSAERGCHVPARCSRLAGQAGEEKGGAAKNKAINALPLLQGALAQPTLQELWHGPGGAGPTDQPPENVRVVNGRNGQNLPNAPFI